MRLKAITIDKSPVLSTGNNGGKVLSIINKDTRVTVIDVKKDGANTYYFVEEYDGYIKRTLLKILRDEEFYYRSTLLRNKINRSATSVYAMANNISVSQPLKPGQSSKDAWINGYNNTVAKRAAQSEATAKLSANNNNVAEASKSVKGQATDSSYSKAVVDKIKSSGKEGKKAQEQIDYQNYRDAVDAGIIPSYGTQNAMSAAGIGAAILGSKMNNPVGQMGATLLNSFASTGSWDEANNTDLSSMFGGSSTTFGQAMKGATISNLASGEFFKNPSMLFGNLVSIGQNLLNNYLSTLMQ